MAEQRGFAAMDPEKQREIARKGGESVPAEKRRVIGEKGAQALKEKHEEEGLTEAERRQRSEAGRRGGENR